MSEKSASYYGIMLHLTRRFYETHFVLVSFVRQALKILELAKYF